MDETLISRPYSERKLLVVADSVPQQAEDLVRALGATGRRGSTSLDEAAADKKADAVIFQTVLQIAAAGAIPAFVNWLITSGLMGIGVVRIGRAYGVRLNREEAGKLAVQFVKSAGITYAGIFVFVQIFTGVAQASVIAYPIAAIVEAAFLAALAFAIGTTAKAYFRGEHRQKELRSVFRTSLKQARKQFTGEALRRLRSEKGGVVFDYERLHQLLASAAGRRVVTTAAVMDPNLSQILKDYLSKHSLRGVEELSVSDLRALDDESGAAHELWELIHEQAGETSEAETTGGAVDQLRLWVGDTSLLVVDQLAVSDIKFPFGHPRSGSLYVGHPSISNLYYPAAEFHFLLFNHKFCEALRLLRLLSATRLEVEHISGRSTEWSSKLDFSGVGAQFISRMAAQVTQESSGSRQSQGHTLYRATFSPPSQPTVPDDMAWYPHEPAWQEIAKGRIEGGLKDFELLVRYTDDFGINQSLCVKLGARGGGFSLFGMGGSLDMGGRFEDHQATIWRVAGSFQ